ncbi:MAG: VCBS repeat-containing protein [Acidobacteria bacterium]|nr:VCBS repeat-containing protein [Acidobacteriota bacterium]
MRGVALGVLVALSELALPAAELGTLELKHVALELPGAPVQLIPLEIDGDPAPELAIVVVYTAWDEIAVEETSRIDEVEGLVAVLTIVPALLENRELRLYDRLSDGTWDLLAEPFELDTDIVTIESTTHPALPLVALTDDGADGLHWIVDESGSRLERRPLVRAATAMAGSGAFLPRLSWVHDLDGDPWPDLLLPVPGGWRLYRGHETGFSTAATAALASPRFDDTETPWRRDIPLPEVRDVDADGLADILIPHPVAGWSTFYVFLNLGDGTFGSAIGPLGDPETAEKEDSGPRTVFFDDLDGDGRAEYVTQDEIELDEKAGMRREMAHAKSPPQRYQLFDMTASLGRATEPRRELLAQGYSFPGGSDIRLPGGLWDLDGDGRRDLVTLTLDFSFLQAFRILVAHSLSIGLDFHILCQQADGSFEPVAGLDLSGRFRLNLNDFRQGQLSMFDGDFDGDGRKDFVQIGRGRKVTIHRGRPGCRFPTKPDLEIELVEAPKDLALVDVADLDGDGLSDLSIIQPRTKRQRNATRAQAPVRLDLYLSGGQP